MSIAAISLYAQKNKFTGGFMKKNLVLFVFCVCLFSNYVFADQIKLSAIPASPRVFDVDVEIPIGDTGETEILMAPWFSSSILIDNGSTKHIYIESFLFNIKNSHGSEVTMTKPIKVEIAPGESHQVNDIYIHGLFSAMDYQFTVRVESIGWIGRRYQPEGYLAVQTTFVTH